MTIYGSPTNAFDILVKITAREPSIRPLSSLRSTGV
jgi:hypothetical protein